MVIELFVFSGGGKLCKVSKVCNFYKFLKFLFAGGGDTVPQYVVIELFVFSGGGKVCKVSNIHNTFAKFATFATITTCLQHICNVSIWRWRGYLITICSNHTFCATR